jgi:predicted deacylase
MNGPFEIAGRLVQPGKRERVDIPVGRRVTRAEVALPVEVVHGTSPGPRLFVCAAVHGDEINGVEIIRRLLRQKLLPKLRGTLIAVPVVNLFGFIGLSRYLPDRRDLNRSFPGSPTGSLASRLADTFVREVVDRSTHGIDLHTAAVHRSNLPQIRACLDDEETARLARAFGVPVLIDATVRDGSLRQAVYERKAPMLLFEGGEALRFDEQAIRAGVRGVLSTMAALEMLPARRAAKTQAEPFVARSSHWIRAPESGILRERPRLGELVEAGQKLGTIADPLGADQISVRAEKPGIVIGRTELPLVNEGDALFHIATFARPAAVSASVEEFQDEIGELG